MGEDAILTQSFLPMTFDPKHIDHLLGYWLINKNGVSEYHFTEENVACWDFEEDSAEMARHIHDAAIVSHLNAKDDWPDTDWRQLSKLHREHSTHYWYEVFLTPAGRRALECSEKWMCCDELGYLSVEATVRYWLEHIASLKPTYVDFNLRGLLIDTAAIREEDWGRPVADALALYEQGLRVTRAGRADYPATVTEWFSHLTTSFFEAPERIAEFRANGFLAKWENNQDVEIFKRRLDMATKMLFSTSDGKPRYKHTVEFWLDPKQVLKLSDHKNHFMALDEPWAQPIQEHLMLKMMKSPHVPLIA